MGSAISAPPLHSEPPTMASTILGGQMRVRKDERTGGNSARPGSSTRVSQQEPQAHGS